MLSFKQFTNLVDSPYPIAYDMGMDKTCTGCGQTKSVEYFTKRQSASDGRNSRCKDCTRSVVKKHYYENRQYYLDKQNKRNQETKKRFDKIIRKHKAVPCADCEIKYHFAAMDFDHIRGEKKFNVGLARQHTENEEVLLEEISKCEVVCANCHRVRTYKRTHKGL